jgi:soluble lytic murein transglycosylase-like protein
MPVIPAPDPSVRLAPLGDARLRAADNPSGDIIANGARGLAQSLDSYAQSIEQTGHLVREAGVREAQTRLMETVQSVESDFLATQGRASLDGRTAAEDQLTKAQRELSATFKDRRAQAMWGRVSTAMLLDSKRRIATHALQQGRVYADAASMANEETAIDTFAQMRATDPSGADRYLATAYGEAENRALSKAGLQREAPAAATILVQARRGVATRAHALAIQQIVAASPLTGVPEAVRYLDAHRNEIDPATAAGLEAKLRPAYIEWSAKSVADAALSEATGEPQPSAGQADLPVLFQAVAGVESGNRDRDASGRLIVSPKGAMGRMQVMPSTAANPGYGIRPARPGDDEELARVGREKLGALIKRYDGNLTLALTAYNAGEGRVDEWLQRFGDPRKGNISDAEWRTRVPFAESRDYSALVMARYQKLKGASVSEADRGLPRYANQQAVFDQIDANPSLSPEIKIAAKREAAGRLLQADQLRREQLREIEDGKRRAAELANEQASLVALRAQNGGASEAELSRAAKGLVDAGKPIEAMRYLATNLPQFAVGQARALGPGDTQAVLRRYQTMLKAAGGPDASPPLAATVEALQEHLRTKVDAYRSDPVAAGQRFGLIKPQVLRFSDPKSMAQRIQDASRVAAQAGTPLQLFTNAEAADLARKTRGSPAERADVIERLTYLPPAYQSAALNQVARDDKVIAHALALGLNGGGIDAVNQLFVGMEQLKATPDIIDKAQASDRFNSDIGRAFARVSEFTGSLKDTADALYAADRLNAGKLSKGFNPKVYADALNRAAGGIKDNRGVWRGGLGDYRGQRVLLPNGVTADEFADTMSTLSDTQLKRGGGGLPVLNGRPVGAVELRAQGAVPVAFGQNVYELYVRNRPVGGADGKPYRFDYTRLGKRDAPPPSVAYADAVRTARSNIAYQQ